MQEAENIVSFGEGKIELIVAPTGEDKTKIFIDCGRRYRFEVARIRDD